MPQEKIIIKFEAKGHKPIIDALNKLAAAQRLATDASKKQAKAGGILDTGHQRLAKTNGLLANSFATIRSKLLLFTFAMSMGVRQLIGFTKEAAKIESMAMAFHTLSGGSQNAAGAMEALRNATNGTMSEFDLFQQANNAMILGVSKNSDEMAEMFDIAQRLGRALGRDTRSSVESLITGIGRQSRLMLDNIGIIVKAEEAYESYADKLGKTVDTLSDSEKKTAFLQATMASAREKVERLGDETLTTTDSFDRFGASISEIARRIGDELKPATSSLMDMFSDWVDSTREITFEQAYNTKSLEVLQKFIKQTRFEIRQLKLSVSDSSESFRTLSGATPAVRAEIERLEQIIISAQPHLIELGIAAEEFGDVCEEGAEQVNLFDETVGDSIPNLLFVNELYAKSKEAQLELVEARLAVLDSFIAMHGATNEEAVALQVLLDLQEKLIGGIKGLNRALEKNIEMSEMVAFGWEALAKSIERPIELGDIVTTTLEDMGVAANALAIELYNLTGLTDSVAQGMLDVANSTMSTMTSINQMGSDTLQNQRQEAIDHAKATIHNEGALKAKLTKINDDFDAKEKKRRKDLKPWMQAAALAQGALSVLNVWAEVNPRKGFWQRLAESIAVGAAAAVQINQISAANFEQGGLIGGRRHSQGGTMIEAEQGEFVMSRSAVQSVGIENLNRMNEGGGGSAVTVNVSGNVLSQDFVEGELAENIKEAIRRGTDFGIS